MKIGLNEDGIQNWSFKWRCHEAPKWIKLIPLKHVSLFGNQVLGGSTWLRGKLDQNFLRKTEDKHYDVV